MSRFYVVLVCLLLLVSGFAYSQDAPRAEVFGGYQYLHVGDSGINFNLNGWNAAVNGYFNRYVGVTGDFSGTYGTPKFLGVGLSTKVYTYMFGPVVRFPNHSTITPFAHALFGGARATGSAFGVSASDNAFAWAAGGGVDAKVAPHVSIRVGQFDFLQSRFASTHQNNFRYSGGVVFHF